MTDEQVRQTLLLEAHRCVDGAADATVAKIGSEAPLTYPPGNSLTPEEEQAIRSMKLSPVERSALKKLIADGCATAFFDFFNLIDATADPEVEPQTQTWLGAWLVAPKDDRDRDMLHDGFYESYWAYAAQRQPD